ncbi:MAG: chemotaxis protein CheB, partial [Gemmatimonadales bacterium]
TNGSRRHGPHSTIDPFFRCAARSYGSRVIGVLLSGTLDDGTAGLLAIRRGGGLVVVQDPGETEYPGMVLSALEQLDVDHIARAGDMGALIDRLVRLAAPPPPPSGRRGRVATEVKHKPPLTGSTSQ